MIRLFESAIIPEAEQAMDFLVRVLESSTQYSIIAKDLDGKILLWNEGARRLYGYEPEEVVGRAYASILHTPEDVRAGKPQEIMDAALRDGKWEGTIERLRKDGRRFIARVVITPRLDVAGRPRGFLLMSKDVSEEFRLAEELRRTQFYTRSLIESNIDALMTTDPAGIITDVNKQMETLTGHAREDLIGTPFKQYFTQPERAEQGIRRVLREGRVTNYELTAVAKDGHTTVVSYNASILHDADGKRQGVFAAARDITERKRFEQTLQEKNVELQRAGESKDRFLASMSHELRTPLNAIIGFAGTLLMGLPGPLADEQRKQLEIVQGSAKHLVSLINDLLDLAKIESGKVETRLEPVVCQEVMEETADSLRPLAASKGLSLEVRAPQEAVRIRTDRRTLSQILLNLLSNAISFTEKGGVVLSLNERLQDGERRVELSVADTGVGIRPQDQAKLFQAFAQMEAPGRRREGTGLGLHISQKLAALLGGTITFQSEYGKGSMFTIVLAERQPWAPAS